MKTLIDKSGVATFQATDFEIDEDGVYRAGYLRIATCVAGDGCYVVDSEIPVGQMAAPIEVPVSVTMRQARLALLAAGKLNAVSAAIASLPSPQKDAAQIEWEYSSSVERHRPLVAMLGPALGLNDAQLDALFVQAAGL